MADCGHFEFDIVKKFISGHFEFDIVKKFQSASSPKTSVCLIVMVHGHLKQFAKYWACESQ